MHIADPIPFNFSIQEYCIFKTRHLYRLIPSLEVGGNVFRWARIAQTSTVAEITICCNWEHRKRSQFVPGLAKLVEFRDTGAGTSEHKVGSSHRSTKEAAYRHVPHNGSIGFFPVPICVARACSFPADRMLESRVRSGPRGRQRISSIPEVAGC